jgi:hypothetical protein
MQSEMGGARDYARGHHRFKFCAQCQFVHETGQVALSQRNKGLNSQAFTTFGATRVNHSASSTGFHAHQKAMGASAACF